MRWQYRVVNLGAFHQQERLTATLGSLGAEGWELAGVYDKGSNWLAGMEKGFLLFKRAVPEGAEPDGPWAVALYADSLSGDVSGLPAGMCGCGFQNLKEAQRCERCKKRLRVS